jgi:cob(I)alamin adenosyltransferase
VSDDYRKALEAACREYEQVAAEHARLETRLGQLKQTIGTLNKLCGFEATVPWSLTDACRVILRSAGRPMTAIEVRNSLDAAGLDFTRYSNALSAIHTVLKRLVEGGQVVPRELDESERVAYEFLASGMVASRVSLKPPHRSTLRKKT